MSNTVSGALRHPAPRSKVTADAWRIASASKALGVPRRAIESLLTINRADRVRIITAAATLAEEAMQ